MKINPASYVDELQKLRQVFINAETELISTIGYKRQKGFVDYAETAALDRVQKILQTMIDDSWKYVPTAIEKQYKLGKAAEVGYKNAQTLTTTQHNVVDRLVNNLMGTITEAAATANKNIPDAWQESLIIGRRSPDNFRTDILEAAIQGEASGMGISRAKAVFLEKMKKDGIVAFKDAVGRNWSIRAYADMATRTTSRQATNLGTLFADEDHDLYKMSSIGSTCPICAPLEGRVYSRSGTHPVYPPLAAAFGKIDPNGPDDLENTYLNIHPNCRHTLSKWTEAGRSEKELKEIQEKSSFKTNPKTHDPRSEAQKEAYHKKEQGRSQLMNDMRQYERYKVALGDKMPKTFQTFQKHKNGGSEKYEQWQSDYRNRNKQINETAAGANLSSGKSSRRTPQEIGIAAANQPKYDIVVPEMEVSVGY